ncbi:ABC transporter substrate-binding protein [Actinoallomurus purpureus]|uniref:ABC transporter substrate-binding protein n=1 Tax=Actinoallomurus purpureus TaxID=478114 RepID=UPI0020934C95|nr:ABC transporter substrate-binding protein [Actinoallomurus purpureus]MCO6007784.1 ABC transporter substrate-binding protein [Actinoallomurus purpureus]
MRGRFAACAALLVLGVTACGGGRTTARPDTSFDQASSRVVHPSTARGGTLRLAVTDAPVSLDPGDVGLTYEADLARLYARSLVTYAAAPGAAGLRLVPDLAEGLGRPGDGGRTWTYRLRRGITYEDGTPVRARDVKYAVARSGYTAQLTHGPRGLRDALTGTYWGPYLDPDLDHFTGVTTPDDRTVVFHLKRADFDFDHLAASPQTAPVPRVKDTRLAYEKHPLSTGPYRFARHDVGTGFTLVRNPRWRDDPNRAALPDRIEVTERVAAADIDARLRAGTLDADLAGAGVQPATRDAILAAPALRARADDPPTGLVRYAALSTGVAPLDDVHCRRAVQYAVDRTAIQRAYGGPTAGTPATNVLPPTATGYRPFDRYPRDLARARAELRACGRPGGFTTGIAVRGDRPDDVAAARAVRQALADAGIGTQVTTLSAFQWGSTAGSPAYVHRHGLGVLIGDWAADRPTGPAFLRPLTGPAAKTNNANPMELRDPRVDRLLAEGARTPDPRRRADLSAEADRAVMETGAFVPLLAERTVLYRPDTLAGAYVHPAYGMYDYAALGRRTPASP